MGFVGLVRADAKRYGVSSPLSALRAVVGLSPFWLVLLYRIGHDLHRRHVPLVPSVLRAAGMVVWGAELWPSAAAW